MTIAIAAPAPAAPVAVRAEAGGEPAAVGTNAFAALLDGGMPAPDASSVAADPAAPAGADDAGGTDDPVDAVAGADVATPILPADWLASLRQATQLLQPPADPCADGGAGSADGTSVASPLTLSAAAGGAGGPPKPSPPIPPTTDDARLSASTSPLAAPDLADQATTDSADADGTGVPIAADSTAGLNANGTGMNTTAIATTPAPADGFATLLHAALPAEPAHRAAALPGAAPMPTMLLAPEANGFGEALAERIVWVTDSGLDRARIELNPAELGALSVQVEVRGSEAQVSFNADSAATRAILQQALPQLRELFSGQGLQLLRSQIEARPASGAGGSDAGRSGFESPRPRNGGAPLRRVTRLHLVDAYV